MSALLEKKLARAEARIAILERMIEDKTRQLFLANEELRASNEGLTELYRVLPGAILVVNAEGTVVQANEATLDLLGYGHEELVGTAASEVGLGHRVGDADEVWHREEDWISADGEVVPVLVSSVQQRVASGVRAVVSVAVDLRDRKKQEVGLRHAQKLESIGQLAAGIAHEINTPMQFIGDNVEFLASAFEDVLGLVDAYQQLVGAPAERRPSLEAAAAEAAEDADLEYLQERVPRAFDRTREGVRRVASIVAGMKVFSHPGNDKSQVDLNASVETTLSVARHEYKYVAEVKTALGEIPAIHAQAGDINQVLLNLVVNAAHAVEAKQKQLGSDTLGTITITTRQDGDAVELQLSDTGCGIPAEMIGRIFDPFFTTKDVGKGTGQGLALAHAVVVDRHHGSLTVDSEPGVGTTFTIRLPIELPTAAEVAA